ncbi:MAG TPA: glycosyltransferase family 4 protein [Acidimicrobiales bacterium]|nr:glycosyltransferase family 4 protein [Acidimicrobiales bacterium]
MAEASGRLLQLLGPSTGGIRRHVVELSRLLAERGWVVELAGPAGVLDGLGHLDHRVEVPAGPAPRAAWTARRALARSVAGADLVHAHGLKAGWLAASLASPTPLVVTAHNVVLDNTRPLARAVLSRMESALPRRCDALVVVSGEMARRLTGIPGADRVRVIAPVAPPPRPVTPVAEVRASLGAGPTRPLVVNVARLHPQKDQATLVEAAALLARRVSGVRVAVVGTGPDRATLARQVERRGLGETVVLAGARPGADVLAAADVVTLASRWEGWPLVVAEAMQLGRPVVATAVGGIPEMIVDGESAWLVPAGDPEALAAALGEALADPEEAARRAWAAEAAFRRRYHPEVLVDAVEGVYRSVLGR